MIAATLSAERFLEQEARALLTRLGRVKPFALQETMLPAAALSPAALIAIERLLVTGRFELREQVLGYLRWLRSEGRAATPNEMQRRFTLVRLRFNNTLSQFDSFSEVITQRSESETGVWLSGLDVFAGDALALPGGYFEQPQVICYLARGPGAAIRRARTRIPGGAQSPVAMVRVPRERLVGHGIASSMVHEVGHQAAALLSLVPFMRPQLQAIAARGSERERVAWGFWERWISEIVADVWSVGKLGISSTLGLIGVVSLPSWFVFRVNADDPHPIPWIRVKLSCAVGDALYPHRQWRELAALWESMYPRTALPPARRQLLATLEETLPRFVTFLVDNRPPALRGRSLGEVMPREERHRDNLLAFHRAWKGNRAAMRDAPPSLAFAVIGQARFLGAISAEDESRVVANLLTYWALRSTLDTTELCATPPAPPVRARATERSLLTP
ncbi:MAG: hypothetical protein ACXVSL_06180 [Solirubrobacteraceae bacterium]